jgi:hypothetical protein
LLKADLTKPDIVAHEVDRLIASPKADEFVSGFVHQWLGMDRLDFFQFDTKQFRDFDESAKAAARREVYETFAHLLRNNGSLTKLLKSDEIHVNGLLAAHVGVGGLDRSEDPSEFSGLAIHLGDGETHRTGAIHVLLNVFLEQAGVVTVGH